MKKSLTALALAFALAGALTACSNRDPNTGSNTANGGGTASGSGAGASAGQVSRRYGGPSGFDGRYYDDGRYTAGTNGQVYDRTGGTASRDLTRDAREIVRDAGDAIGDVGRSIGNAARDMTGNYSGAPSMTPDSSAARY